MNLKRKMLPANAASSNFRRRSLKVAADVPQEIPQNDDEAERQQRRKDSGKFTHLAEMRLSTGAGSSASSTGTSFVEFSAAELVTQYENCIKLSFANKINHKNAFSLPLIDCMKALLKKKDAQMNNFQFVSCTLDASAKIYASRVDRVHMDGLNFAQNLGGQPRAGAAHSESDNEPDEADDPKASKAKRKYKKKRRNLDDTSKITLAISQQVKQDATYTYMRKQFSNCQPGFTSFVPRLTAKGDGCRVLLDLREPLLSPDHASPPALEEAELVEVPVDLNADLSAISVCPTYRDALNCEADNVNYDALLQPSPAEDESGYEFNVGDGGDDLPCEAVDEDLSVGAFCETMATSMVSGPTACALEGNLMKEKLVDVGPASAVSMMFESVISGAAQGVTGDYLSNQKLDRALWAGPAHWQRLPLVKAREGSAADPTKRKERRAVAIDYLGELTDIEMVSSKRTVLTPNYLKQNWSVAKVTNPTDLHIDAKVLTRLFLRPQVEVFKFGVPEKQVGSQEVRTGCRAADDDNDHDVCQYDYDNLNDSQNFCPDVNQESFDGSADGGEGNNGPPVDIHTMDSQQGQGEDWQMVAPPVKVARIVMNFAQHAKKVDMKKLKKIIWRCLVKEGEAESMGKVNVEGDAGTDNRPPEDMQTQMQEVTIMKGSVDFSRLLALVFERVPKEMAQDLSMALVFTALLHLANEKVLVLDGKEDFSDISIKQHPSAASIVHKHDKRQYK